MSTETLCIMVWLAAGVAPAVALWSLEADETGLVPAFLLAAIGLLLGPLSLIIMALAWARGRL